VGAIKRTIARSSRRLVALVVLAGFLVSVPATAGAGNPLVRPHQLAPSGPPSGSKALGALPATQQVSLSVVLPPADNAGLQSLLSNLYDPSSPQYHQWLQPGQYAAEFGPSSSDVASVQSWLHSRGLNATSVSGSAIKVAATAGTVSTALGTSFEKYRSPSGVEGYAAQETPLVPEDLANGQITSIVGLNTLSKYEPADLDPTPVSPSDSGGSLQPNADGLTPCSSAQNAQQQLQPQGLRLDQVGAAYGINSLLTQGENGHGETIGLYELAPHISSDVSTYLNCFGLSNAVSTVPVDGGALLDPNGTVEADLDIEQAATQAPQASIISYEGPNDNPGIFDVWNTIVNDDAAQVVSTSWGECEALAFPPGPVDPYDDLFMQAAAQGQSVFAATGDSGSEDCFPEEGNNSLGRASTADYPASDPGITAVGGTTLGSSSEVVWNSCQSQESILCAEQGGNGAGGGGVSEVAGTHQSYQPVIDQSTQASQPCAGTCREVPDVSANAGTPMEFFVDGNWSFAFGTSFAAPLWAGLTADKNDGCTEQTGLFNAALYSLNAEGSYGTAFKDITTGNNDLTGTQHGDFAAGTGYDLASGIGSPIAGGLSCPEVTSVGQGQVGQTVVVQGLGLAHAVINFGGSPATVVGTPTDTQATVIVPAGSGTVMVSGTSAALGSGTMTSSFTYPAITTTSLAPGIVGAPYLQTLTAAGVPSSESWTIADGSLPSPLVLNASTGVISGTPTTPSPAQSVTFQVTAGSIVLSVALSIQVFDSSSSTTATVNPAAADLSASVTYAATVSSPAGTPSGTVAFSVGSTALCTTPALAGGAASCSSTAAPSGIDTVTATYVPTGDVIAPSSFNTSLDVSSGPYSPIAPVRICDTRPESSFSPTNQCTGATIGAGLTKTISVANGSPIPANATSVVLNVTAVNPAAPGGFMTVYPTGTTQPTASNLNYTTGETVANLVQVGVGTSGDVSFFSSSRTDLVVDVEGYTSGGGAGLYTALSSPARLCDTRAPSSFTPANQCNGPGSAAGTLLAPGSKIVQVTNGPNGSIPNGATAAVLNVTAVNPTASGFLTVYPTGQSQPNASNVNFAAGQTTTNRVIVPLSSSGKITVASSVPTDLVVDISGYNSSAPGAQFNAESSPIRICDSRPLSSFSPSNQCTAQPINPGGSMPIRVTGLANVPSGATAVVVNITGVGPTQPTFLTVFPGGTVPNASDLNLATGETTANLDVATLNPTNGKITIRNQTGSVNVIVDVLGWYS
jgi:Pro-kumamolisin, activation domain/Bacterial Ig-like domain (group 3)